MTLGRWIEVGRKMEGLSIRELATKVGVSHTAISNYEKNNDVPGSEILIKIAKALKKPIHFFFRSSEPVEINAIDVMYRKKSTFRKKDESILHSAIADKLERYLMVEKIMGIEWEPFSLPHELRKGASSLEEIEILADKLRLEWNLGNGPLHDIVEILEDHGIKVIFLQGSENFDALLFNVNGKPVIVVNNNREIEGDRLRFNICHELGHLVTKQDDDKFAHRFAGAFLVPKENVYKELNHKRTSINLNELHTLKHLYGMSMQAWVRRARDLGVISNNLYENFFKYSNQNGCRKIELGDPYPIDNKPSRMLRLIYKGISENIISTKRAEELWGGPLPDIEKKGV